MTPHMSTPCLVVEKRVRYRVRPDSPQLEVILALNLQSRFSTASAARSRTAVGFGEATGAGAAVAAAASRAVMVAIEKRIFAGWK